MRSSSVQLRAQAQLELHKRGLVGVSPFARYRFDPLRYIQEKLRWEPWRGDSEHPGQADILDAYALALRQQHERRAYDAGQLAAADLQSWQPGQTIQNQIRVEAGHTVGKTTLAAGIVSHFFDCFAPSVTYCFAPGHAQINDLLFKEIRKQRAGKGLPGKVLKTPEITDGSGDHFVKGKATNNAHGQGTERAQGQHEQYLLFIIDEAEGVADYVFDAIRSMTSGGISLVVMLANPRTRSSRFHRAAAGQQVCNFRMSCVYHPNVLAGRELIPGAVMRDYVETMINDGQTQHAEIVDRHDPDLHTFELPWRPGVIYRPDHEFMFRVLGVAPEFIADDVFVPTGRYLAATKRLPVPSEPHIARLGIDAARFGKDMGTLYTRHNGRLYRAAQFPQQDSGVYLRAIRAEALLLAAQGVTDIAFRVDGGGGFGSAVIDGLTADLELRRRFLSYQVLEVHFNAAPSDPSAYADLASELYGHTAEALKTLAILNAPNALEADLCERKFTWVTASQHQIKRDVKEIQSKKVFHQEHGRSPDDGDGAALACAADRIFKQNRPARQASYLGSR